MANDSTQNADTIIESSEASVDGCKIKMDISRREEQSEMEIRTDTVTMYQTNRGTLTINGPFESVASFLRNCGLVNALRIDGLSYQRKFSDGKAYMVDTMADSVSRAVEEYPLEVRISFAQVIPRGDDSSSDELAGADMSASADDWEAPTTEPDESDED